MRPKACNFLLGLLQMEEICSVKTEFWANQDFK